MLRSFQRPTISTPALISILKSNNKLPSPTHRNITPPSSYTPTSLSDLVTRISTYSLTSYLSGKPISLSPLSCALLGWKNAGKERLECVTCGKGFIVAPPTTGGWSGTTGKKLATKWENDSRDCHDKSCPWKVRGCSRSLYRIKLESRGDMIRDLKKNGQEMQRLGLGEMKVTTVSLKEEDGVELVRVINTFVDTIEGASTEASSSTSESSIPPVPSALSLTIILLALFGWNLSSNATPTSIILTCPLCTRRVLANSYLPSNAEKTFDPSSSHQAFCSFINSTSGATQSSSPSLAVSSESILGWESRLKVILNKVVLGRGSSWASSGKFKSGVSLFRFLLRSLLVFDLSLLSSCNSEH